MMKSESISQRIGVPWLGGSCTHCSYCLSVHENLCDSPAGFTSYQIDGDFAEYCVADARFCFLLPENYLAVQASPLLCAGLSLILRDSMAKNF
jgi:propanol-preferring alcohol dehydrogenase